MKPLLTRRALIGAGLALPLLAGAGCTTPSGFFSMDKAVRRLLTVSAQRAFAGLLRDGGFFDDAVARVTLPPQLGGSGAASLLAQLLQSEAVQARLLRQVNHAAERAARAATPFVLLWISSLSIPDAMAIVRGGPTAATGLLQRSMRDALADALLPEVGAGLRAADGAIVVQALGAATGIDFEGLSRDVARKAAEGIYRAIGREEAAIRANPRTSGDDRLIGVFSLVP